MRIATPLPHPEAIIEPGEAFGFFSQALSVISLMLAATKELDDKRQPMFDGFAAALGGLQDGWKAAPGTVKSIGELQSGDEETPDGFEVADSEQDSTGEAG